MVSYIRKFGQSQKISSLILLHTLVDLHLLLNKKVDIKLRLHNMFLELPSSGMLKIGRFKAK